LLSGLISDTTGKMEAVAETLIPSTSIEKSITLFIHNYFKYLEREKRFLKLQLTLILMPELKEIVRAPLQQRAELLLKILFDWFKQANINKPKSKARVLLAMLDGVALHYLSVYDKYPLRSMKQQVRQTAKDLCH